MELLKYNSEINDWEDITQSSVIKTRQYIQDNILGCSFDLFKTAIVVSASDSMNFYENMGKQAKRNFIENIFNLNCFGIMFADIKSDLNSLKKEITYLNNEILKTAQRAESLSHKYEDFDKKLSTDIQSLKEEMLAKYNELTGYKNTINTLKAELATYDELSETYSNIKLKVKKLNAGIKTVESEILEIKYNIKSINQVLSEIKKLKAGLCETCTELFNSRYEFDKKTQEIESLNAELEVKNGNLEKLNTALETYQTEEETVSTQLSDLSAKKHEEDRLIYKVQMLTDDIKKLKVEYDKLSNDASNPFKELLEKSQDELSQLKTQMINYVNNSKHLELLRDACSENGVKRFIIKDIVKLLNSLIQKYLNEIGAEYLVYFDESFEFKFITVNGECEFSNFSTGERQRIQIATLLAFRDLILNGKINSNIFVIDEFLDSGIDAIAIKNILNILAKKSIESNQNIFIISHRQETTESVIFNHIIEVIKENGISTLKIN